MQKNQQKKDWNLKAFSAFSSDSVGFGSSYFFGALEIWVEDDGVVVVPETAEDMQAVSWEVLIVAVVQKK